MHVRELGLSERQDRALWELAKRDGFVILTQDDDFTDLIALHGPPPKVVHLAKGNLTTKQWVSVLSEHVLAIQHFAVDDEAGLLVIS